MPGRRPPRPGASGPSTGGTPPGCAPRFYEFLPNTGSVGWDVDPWGRWSIRGRTDQFEALVEAACEAPGTPLRAPTIDEGLAPFCRDSFCGTVGGEEGGSPLGGLPA